MASITDYHDKLCHPKEGFVIKTKLILLILALTALVASFAVTPTVTPEPLPPVADHLTGATIAVTGDIIPHEAQLSLALQPDGTYNFNSSFRFIGALLHRADLCIGNLETPMAGKEAGHSGYPRFNAPPELAAALKAAGFDVLSTANNHMLDQGKQGVINTIRTLKEHGLQNTGTSAQAPNQPLVTTVNDITLALVAWTTLTNNPAPASQLLNYTPLHQPDPILEDIRRASTQADITILLIHWGQEYQTEPDLDQRRLARMFAEAGADLVLGCHPHVPQPLEWIITETKTTLVAYSLGNFWSNQHVPLVPTHLAQYGITLQINLTKNHTQETTQVTRADYEITWVHRSDGHRIIPLTLLFEQHPENFNIPLHYMNPLMNRRRQITEIMEAYGFSPGPPPKK